MKYPWMLWLASLLIASGMSLNAQQESGFSAIMDQTDCLFSNELMYKEQMKWIGRTIGFNGAIELHPDFCDIGKPYEIITGRNNAGDPIIVIALLDHPIPTTEGYGDKGARVAKTESLRFFGTVRKSRETVTRTGNPRVLPVLDVQLIYRIDDQTYRNPVWLSRSLRSGG
ncbi:MAG: hypothetical protein NTV54_15840 [Ignavibacteriales bacterium]|nr:hypothetical protein [Ignavibacteriales bacterium]